MAEPLTVDAVKRATCPDGRLYLNIWDGASGQGRSCETRKPLIATPFAPGENIFAPFLDSLLNIDHGHWSISSCMI